MNQEEIKKILPHRDNMLLVEESESVDENTAKGRYTIKFVTGEIPSRIIYFFRKPYSSKASDKAIFQQSQLVEKLKKDVSVK